MNGEINNRRHSDVSNVAGRHQQSLRLPGRRHQHTQRDCDVNFPKPVVVDENLAGIVIVSSIERADDFLSYTVPDRASDW